MTHFWSSSRGGVTASSRREEWPAPSHYPLWTHDCPSQRAGSCGNLAQPLAPRGKGSRSRTGGAAPPKPAAAASVQEARPPSTRMAHGANTAHTLRGHLQRSTAHFLTLHGSQPFRPKAITSALCSPRGCHAGSGLAVLPDEQETPGQAHEG